MRSIMWKVSYKWHSHRDQECVRWRYKIALSSGSTMWKVNVHITPVIRIKYVKGKVTNYTVIGIKNVKGKVTYYMYFAATICYYVKFAAIMCCYNVLKCVILLLQYYVICNVRGCLFCTDMMPTLCMLRTMQPRKAWFWASPSVLSGSWSTLPSAWLSTTAYSSCRIQMKGLNPGIP